jgi:hypothetical protein
VIKSLSLLVALAVALVATPALAAGPVSGQQAKAHLNKRLPLSSKVYDKTRPFKTTLGGKKGDVVRPFIANNFRRVPLGPAITGLRGLSVEGTLNTQTGAVRTTKVTGSLNQGGGITPRF